MRSITTLFFLFCFLAPSALAQLRFGFYGRSCPRAESIVANVVANRFRRDRSITAALLRMQFHDCFVRGCDASLLIDPRPGRPSEKSTGPNASVRGYEIIDEATRLLEAACPRTVSCSDIVTLATRDSVALAGGPRFSVPTGRRFHDSWVHSRWLCQSLPDLIAGSDLIKLNGFRRFGGVLKILFHPRKILFLRRKYQLRLDMGVC
ncbi:unnamed protein product [Brassica oleracea var. botrytis]